jgi:hypothetical protein
MTVVVGEERRSLGEEVEEERHRVQGEYNREHL